MARDRVCIRKQSVRDTPGNRLEIELNGDCLCVHTGAAGVALRGRPAGIAEEGCNLEAHRTQSGQVRQKGVVTAVAVQAELTAVDDSVHRRDDPRQVGAVLRQQGEPGLPVSRAVGPVGAGREGARRAAVHHWIGGRRPEGHRAVAEGVHVHSGATAAVTERSEPHSEQGQAPAHHRVACGARHRGVQPFELRVAGTPEEKRTVAQSAMLPCSEPAMFLRLLFSQCDFEGHL